MEIHKLTAHEEEHPETTNPQPLYDHLHLLLQSQGPYTQLYHNTNGLPREEQPTAT